MDVDGYFESRSFLTRIALSSDPCKTLGTSGKSDGSDFTLDGFLQGGVISPSIELAAGREGAKPAASSSSPSGPSLLSVTSTPFSAPDGISWGSSSLGAQIPSSKSSCPSLSSLSSSSSLPDNFA